MVTSLMVASKTRWSFVVHDDGTLRDADEAVLAENLPGCRVIRSRLLGRRAHRSFRAGPISASKFAQIQQIVVPA